MQIVPTFQIEEYFFLVFLRENVYFRLGFFSDAMINTYLRLEMLYGKNCSKKIGFSVHNYHLNLVGQVENYKWLLFNQKIVIKCGYLRFFIYKPNKIPVFNKRFNQANHFISFYLIYILGFFIIQPKSKLTYDNLFWC